jgi:hypothetical protein
MFAAEGTLDSLVDAGYQNGFEGLPLPERVTHPGTHGFRDATFDFIFPKGLTALQPHHHLDECVRSLARDAQFPFKLISLEMRIIASKFECRQKKEVNPLYAATWLE